MKAEQADTDVKIAGDISNVTGIDMDTILKMKNEGLSWNEILEELRDGKGGSDRVDRSNMLLNQSLEEELINQLKKEGFKEEEIIEARLLIERVQFQLNEITNEEQTVSIGSDFGAESDINTYRNLAANIDLAGCLPMLLRLRNDFGSFEKVLDEYLYCIQLDMDLSLYIKDKEEYLEAKQIKAAGKNLITVQNIEEVMLMKLQNQNTENRDTVDNFELDQAGSQLPGQDVAGNMVPDAPAPKIENLTPENPADVLMNEINEIDPMRNN
ncbi:MAG: hypothetical protein GX115_04545 [Ruminiclostridium sp.]|nr:hypothetical protein [Ruminiclostridium sp.]